MLVKKIKRLIALALVVSFITPTINVQAVENEFKVISTESSEEVKQEENLDTTEIIEEEIIVEAQEDINSENEVTNEKSSIEVIDNETNEKITNENTTNEVKSLEINNIDNKEIETNNSEEKKEELKGKVYGTKKVNQSKVAGISSFSSLSMVSTYSNSSYLNEDEQYKRKKSELESMEVLVPMTDSKYELAIANSDGSYEYVESYEVLEDAKAAAVNLGATLTSVQLPAVVNNAGNIIYSTHQMGRMLISRNNAITYSGTVNLYPTEELKTAYTYVNVGSMEDVPVLEMTDKAAKIMVNGYVGWIANNISSGTYNMKLVPLNQVENPSYYTVKNGELVYFISYNMEDTSRGGASLILGKAPTYLSEGKKYLSYDGKYFYDYDDGSLEGKLNSLIGEYRNGSRMGSINRSNPFYLYYLNLPFRSKTVYTAQDIDHYINNNTASNSKLRGLGAALKEAENKYGVNAVLMLSVAINESAKGISYYSLDRNNLFGMGAVDSNPDAAYRYNSPGDSVLDFAKTFISDGYSDPADWRYYGGFLGNKDRGANVKYASDPYWGFKAAQYAYSIDKYLSQGNGNLRDTNMSFLGITVKNTTVVDIKGNELYKISNNLNDYASYHNIPFVINNVQKVEINNKSYYEINPEITKPLYTNGKLNDFEGNYDWGVKGYILASDISTLNVYRPNYEKLFGQTRYETAIELSKKNFDKSEYVILVNGQAIIDGVSATPLASALKAPILLTKTNELTDALKNEIKRLGATKVIAIGGDGVISNNLLNKITQSGISSVKRLGGATRYETSLEVAKFIDSNLYKVENIVVAAGNGEADALSISSVAGEKNMPIILSNFNGPNDTLKAWLKGKNLNNAYIIGGEGVISQKGLQEINNITAQDISQNRIGGINRYETNAKVIEKFYGNEINKVYITVGDPLADSLGAGVVAALNKAPVVLTKYDLQTSQKNVLKNKTTNTVIQIGGTVSAKAIDSLRDSLSFTK